MRAALKTIDDLLRGRMTQRESLAAGRIEAPLGTLVAAGVVLGGIYGAFMGLYGTLRPENASFAQLLATTAKVPLLFILTLFVTYPSLYVVSALFDSRLGHAATLRLLLMAMCANLALLASLGPVTAFFTLCTDSYPFMIVLNVLFFTVAGIAGIGFLRKALDRVFEVEERVAVPSRASDTPSVAPPAPQPLPESPDEEETDFSPAEPRPAPAPLRAPVAFPPRPLRPPTPPASRVFRLWIVIYGVVGAQMGWVLRPFIGSPSVPFELFRSERESNFFAAFLRVLGELFS